MWVVVVDEEGRRQEVDERGSQEAKL